MKRFCYLLSIAGHALALLIILSARFAVTIQPEPSRKGTPAIQPGQSREIVVSIAEPPPAYTAKAVPAKAPQGARAFTAAPGGGGSVFSGSGRSFAQAGEFSLRTSTPGSFRLAPVGKSPEPWAVPIGPGRTPGLQRFNPGTFHPGSLPGGAGGSGGVFLMPFDIGESAVAAWTEAALARIERNWLVPISARLAFSGRVRITLTIEKNGRQRALAMDDTTLPEPLSRSALHAVQASLPLPPLPENVAGETFAFTLVFVYNG